MDIDQLIDDALTEDLPSGDLTTDGLPLNSREGWAKLVAKDDLVLSGTEIFTKTYAKVDPSVLVQWLFRDGELILKGQTLAVLKGPLASLLKGERVALNFLGYLSGIASLTKSFVGKVAHTPCRILDTRKTLPGYRALAKRAVVDGGGLNHRMNLSEAVLIKENHIRAIGGVTAAVNAVKKHTPHPIEVEVNSVAEAKDAVAAGAQRLLLDNMSNDCMAALLKAIPKDILTEASGNMTLDRVKSVAELGVNYISVGALTHSPACADISLLFEWST